MTNKSSLERLNADKLEESTKQHSRLFQTLIIRSAKKRQLAAQLQRGLII